MSELVQVHLHEDQVGRCSYRCAKTADAGGIGDTQQ